MPNITTTLLVLTVILVLLPTETYAFGAGDIPDFAYLNGKAFRHGDIEGILEELVKAAGHSGGGGLIGFAQSVLSQATGGSKFSKSDVKKVYFGNWLRDYSQAMDIAGLSKLTAETIVLVISVLGFMTFGFATEEFQVTADRLGVYLPVEHIDNPKGYAEKEGDARQFHPNLRPPVDPRELEIDERTGMKKYMATEDEGFDTSTAHIRRVLRSCIEHGRRSGGREGPDLWEAYRLLGTGLHTLEDLLAHSNWCEIALVKMGHREVFCHVGDNVRVTTPNGEAPPLVTGTFGGADFLHSLLGEAGDKLSQASVTDLSQRMNSAAQNGDEKTNALRAILKKLPIGGGDEKVDQGEAIHEQAKAYNFDPDNIAPPEVQQQLWELLKWRDNIYRDVLAKIEMVPGLSDLIEELTNALNAYVYTVLAPYLTPILQQATGALNEGSKAVIDSDDQYAVFNDPDASDPSHSILSKDHFGLILNEPAGKIAQVVVEHTVNLIVKAWADDSSPDDVINVILEAFHHPYYASGRSTIQHAMNETLEQWFGGLGPDMERQVIQALTKESVRNGKNKRVGSENSEVVEQGYSRESYGAAASHSSAGSGGYGHQYGGQSTYGEDNTYSSGRRNDHRQESHNTYGSGGGYNRRQDEDSSDQYSSGGGYGRRQDETPSNQYTTSGGYGRRHDEASSNQYSSEDHYGTRRTEDSYAGGGYGGSSHGNYNSGQNEYGDSYASNRRREEYGGETEGYGSRRRQDDGESRRNEYGSSHHEYGGQRDESYGSRREYEVTESSFNSGAGEERHSSRRHHGGDDYESSGNTYEQSNQGYNPGYGREGYSSSRYEDSSRHESGGYQPSYGRSSDEYGGGGYGSRTQRDEYSGGGGGYGEEESSGYSVGRHHGGRHGGYGEESSGYAPSYGGSDETFGAERLNLNDDENEGYGGRRHHRHHNEENY